MRPASGQAPVLRRYAIRWLRPYWQSIVGILGLFGLTNLAALATPYALKILIDDAYPQRDARLVGLLLGGLTVVYVIRILASYWISIFCTRFNQHVLRDIREELYGNILRKPLSFFSRSTPGDIVFAVINDVGKVQSAFTTLVLSLLSNFLLVIGLIIMLCLLNLQLTLIGLVILPVVLLVVRRFSGRITHAAEQVQRREEGVYRYLVDRLSNIRLVRIHRGESAEHAHFSRLQNEVIRAIVNNTRWNALSNNLSTFLVAIGPVIVLLFGSRLVFIGATTVGTLIAFIQYLNRLFDPTLSLVNGYNEVIKSIASLRRVETILDSYRKEEAALPTGGPPAPELHRLYVNGVSLQYDSTRVLDGVELVFERGRTYGIVGASGSGKSSLINLICGFMPPSAGSITVNNREDSIAGFPDWMDQVGWVAREHQLLQGSIRTNLTYARSQISDAAVAEALELVDLNTTVARLEQGWDTEINSLHAPLSDGQKQRLAIGRAHLRAPAIFVLDESTAALDSHLEDSVLSSLRRQHPAAIIVLVAHRISTLSYCDEIFVLDRGILVERGRLDRLKAASGAFARLFDAQFSSPFTPIAV